MPKPTDAVIAGITEQSAHSARVGIVVDSKTGDASISRGFVCSADGALAGLCGEHAFVCAVSDAKPCLESNIGFFVGIAATPLAVVCGMFLGVVAIPRYDRGLLAILAPVLQPVASTVMGVKLALRLFGAASLAELHYPSPVADTV